MRQKIKDLNTKLKDVHKRFLENERKEAEEYFQRKIAPFEFLLMLTQDNKFTWLHPFSALIAEIDAFTDDAEDIAMEDLVCIRNQVDFIFDNSNPNLTSRYLHHLNHDADFIMLHAAMKKVLNDFIGKD
jgi:hypothetical protein